MRPKTDTLTLTRWRHRDAKLLEGLDKSFVCNHPYQIDGQFWSISCREQVSEDKFEYTLTNPCQTLDEWEQAFKPSITTKEEVERLLHDSGSKKPFDPMEVKPDVIYIAGAISGDVESNRHKFMAAKHRILASSSKAVVLNPAELPVGLTQAQYMSICLPMVMASDTIFMLDGWEKSPGASAEFALAKKLNLKIVHEGEYELSE